MYSNMELETDPIRAKRFKASPIDQHSHGMEARPKRRWLCNELVCEFCRAISAEKASDQILLTARNIYTYAERQFRKKRLIFQVAIDFLKANLNNGKQLGIYIDRVTGRKYSEEHVLEIALNQREWDCKFHLEANQFHLCIHVLESRVLSREVASKARCTQIYVDQCQFNCAEMQCFLRLIAPLIRPIQMNMHYHFFQRKPVKGLARFLSAMGGYIDSVELFADQFHSEVLCRALSKCNKMHIYGSLSAPNVPIIVQWLNANNGKKCLFLWQNELNDGLTLLLDEIKKDFVRATTKSRFVVRLELRRPLTGFVLSNDRTGEWLELRCCTSVKNGGFLCVLRRSPEAELENNGNEDLEFEAEMKSMIRLK